MLGLEPSGEAADGELDEGAVVNPRALARLEALGALHLIHAGASAGQEPDSPAARRAELYRLRFAAERGAVVAKLDTDGDGVADVTRRPACRAWCVTSRELQAPVPGPRSPVLVPGPCERNPMLYLHPREVTFGGVTWSNVASVAIERAAARSFVEAGGVGPHAVIADVPEQRVGVTVVQELLADDMDAPVPGWQGTLAFETALNSSGAGRRRVSMAAVVLGVSYRVSRRSGSARTVELVAVSGDGVADPVTVEDV